MCKIFFRTQTHTRGPSPRTWRASGTCSSCQSKTLAWSLMSCTNSKPTTGNLWHHQTFRYRHTTSVSPTCRHLNSTEFSLLLECHTNLHAICHHYRLLRILMDSQLSFAAACRCALRTVMLPAWRHLSYLCFVLFCCWQWAAFEKLLYLPYTVGACPSPMVIFTSHSGHHRALLPHANGCHCEP